MLSENKQGINSNQKKEPFLSLSQNLICKNFIIKMVFCDSFSRDIDASHLCERKKFSKSNKSSKIRE